MTILVTGATGLVGTRLVTALLARGDRVIADSRRHRVGSGPLQFVVADPTRSGPWLDAVKESDAVVHLAGAGVFDRRWTAEYKQEIRHSRVDSTAVLAAALAADPRRADGTPRTFVSASAVGDYGNVDGECLESAPPGDDFLAQVCVAWEAAAQPARDAGVRVVHPRISVVLDPLGGALKQLIRQFQFLV